MKCFGIGNLTTDVKLGQGGQKNTTYASFGMAFNDKIRKETVFINCISFGKAAEIIAKYLSKGSPLFVVGRLREWTGDNEQKKYSVAIDEFQFIGQKNKQNSSPLGDAPEGTTLGNEKSNNSENLDGCPI